MQAVPQQKLSLIDEDANIIYKHYGNNKGNPVDVVKEQLAYIYEKYGDKIKIRGVLLLAMGRNLLNRDLILILEL